MEPDPDVDVECVCEVLGFRWTPPDPVLAIRETDARNVGGLGAVGRAGLVSCSCDLFALAAVARKYEGPPAES